MRDEVVAKREDLAGTKRDDVEFTFKKGKWGHLGEATLANRIRSHPDVGERWCKSFLNIIPLCFLDRYWSFEECCKNDPSQKMSCH